MFLKLILHLYFLERQRKLSKYYKRQQVLLKGYQEVDSYIDLGTLPGNLTEVMKILIIIFSFLYC
jgi:hypothetical protein